MKKTFLDLLNKTNFKIVKKNGKLNIVDAQILEYSVYDYSYDNAKAVTESKLFALMGNKNISEILTKKRINLFSNHKNKKKNKNNVKTGLNNLYIIQFVLFLLISGVYIYVKSSLFLIISLLTLLLLIGVVEFIKIMKNSNFDTVDEERELLFKSILDKKSNIIIETSTALPKFTLEKNINCNSIDPKIALLRFLEYGYLDIVMPQEFESSSVRYKNNLFGIYKSYVIIPFAKNEAVDYFKAERLYSEQSCEQQLRRGLTQLQLINYYNSIIKDAEVLDGE